MSFVENTHGHLQTLQDVGKFISSPNFPFGTVVFKDDLLVNEYSGSDLQFLHLI